MASSGRSQFQEIRKPTHLLLPEAVSSSTSACTFTLVNFLMQEFHLNALL